MEYRRMGRTDLYVSVIGFGGGAIGGILVKGEREEITRTVARAVELGITYFDTASAYGDGASETNLGRALAELRPDVVVGTKVALRPDELDDIPAAITRSIENSLRRLQRDRVDLFQLHNRVTAKRVPGEAAVTLDDVQVALETFAALQAQGKTRYGGINGLGDTEALHQAIALGRADTIQSCYNLLNPSAGIAVPADFPFQDYGTVMGKAAEQDMGVIAIRVLAGGALTGVNRTHRNSTPSVNPIGSSADYATDVALGERFGFLVDEGHASAPVEAAIRFAISHPAVSTAMVGLADRAQLEQAAAAAERGPLPPEALARLPEVWAGF